MLRDFFPLSYKLPREKHRVIFLQRLKVRPPQPAALGTTDSYRNMLTSALQVHAHVCERNATSTSDLWSQW